MKIVEEPKTLFTVQLTIDELKMIRDLTQNNLFSPEETVDEYNTRLSLLVGASRCLGYDINDDGSINRGNMNAV